MASGLGGSERGTVRFVAVLQGRGDDRSIGDFLVMRKEHYSAGFICQSCGGSFQASRSHAKTCGPVCKKRLQRGVDREGLGRRLGERRKKRQVSTTVPFVTAGEKGTLAQRKEDWPHGTEVLQTWPYKMAGRVNWYCSAADIASCYNGVPVSTLIGTFLVLPKDLVKAS